MAISLKSIRYGNIGGSDKPYVSDVYTLNERRDWGLKINPDGAWVQAKKQLELIDSISIAILSDEAMLLDNRWNAMPLWEIAAVEEFDYLEVVDSIVVDAITVKVESPIPASSMAESFSLETF